MTNRKYDLQQIFESLASADIQQVLQLDNYSRINWKPDDQTTLLVDRFDDAGGTSCCF